jgi:hypothetical protein
MVQNTRMIDTDRIADDIVAYTERYSTEAGTGWLTKKTLAIITRLHSHKVTQDKTRGGRSHCSLRTRSKHTNTQTCNT